MPTIDPTVRPTKGVALAASEFFFILLPIIVTAIVLAAKDQLPSIVHSPEWSFAATILTGQAIVKVVSGLLASRGIIAWQRTAVWLSSIIVFLLVPSATILAPMVLAEAPATWMVIMQSLLFLTAAILFLFYGSLGHQLVEGEPAASAS